MGEVNPFLVVNFRNHYILKYEFYSSSSYRTTNVVTSTFKACTQASKQISEIQIIFNVTYDVQNSQNISNTNIFYEIYLKIFDYLYLILH